MKKLVAGFLFASTAVLVQAEISSKDAWIRLLPPSMKTTAAYVTLSSTQSDELISIASDEVEIIEIHEMKMDGGVMKMKPVDSVALPAGSEVELAPGGLHLMLLGLKKTLRKNDQINAVLTFESGTEQEISFTVKKQ